MKDLLSRVGIVNLAHSCHASICHLQFLNATLNSAMDSPVIM